MLEMHDFTLHHIQTEVLCLQITHHYLLTYWIICILWTSYKACRGPWRLS